MTDQGVSFAHHFADLTDPRVERTRLHELLDIVAVAICAVVAGAETWEHIEQFARAKYAWLKAFLALPNGVPSHDTIARVFARLDPDEFQRAFLGWIEALQEATDRRVGALPGHALVVLDPQAMLVADVFPCEDGHAQERSLLDQVLETIRSGEVWIADRNFCTTGFLFGIARRGGHFVIRQHQATLHIELIGERRSCGRAETGTVYEQEARLSDEDGGSMRVRRITVVLDKPTRDGETEIHILTDLPAEAADALTIAELYRRRWTVEAAFGELATCLNGEVNTLGY